MIIDDFGLHLTMLFFDLSIINNIGLFQLSTHSTYLIQSLNIKVFQLFKHYYTEAINQVIRLGDTQFSRIEFLVAFQTLRTQIFKSITICYTFKITRIVPLNLEMVLEKIRAKQTRL